jgi:hypothetical protein
MRKVSLLLVSVYIWTSVNTGAHPGAVGQRNKTRAVRELPFCALVLGEDMNPINQGYEDYVIMESYEMTEENLRLLFKALSNQHSDEPNFQAWVYTDVTQLRELATHTGHSGDDDTLKNHKWAYYSRSPEREYFEFKTKPSENRLSTMVLRGDR